MDAIGRQSPTVSVILPYSATKGPEAVDLYNATEHDVLEWQVALLYDIMSTDNEGLWAHQKFGYSVPRRNGKSEAVLIRCLWGLKNGERIMYTAHRAMTSHKIWERLERLCAKADITVDSSIKAFGKEHLYTADGGVIEFRTRTSTGGLGEGYDLLIIDEAQEYTPEQETSLKYTVTDSPNPQTIMLGTPPTAISAGTVFPKYRKTVLSGAGYESGWAEWSVPDMSDPNDSDLWYETNPSLGTILKERTIRAEIGDDDIDFNIQRLGLWLKYNQKSAISRNEWTALKVDSVSDLTGKLFVGVKFGHDSTNASVSVAVKRSDGNVFVETIDCRSVRDGIEWIMSFIRRADVADVIVDGDAGKTILAEAMKRAGMTAPHIVKPSEVVTASAMFEQAVVGRTICHNGQPALTTVVTNCEHRSIGSGGGFGYKSILAGADISIMESVVLAHWGCKEAKEKKVQRIDY